MGHGSRGGNCGRGRGVKTRGIAAWSLGAQGLTTSLLLKTQLFRVVPAHRTMDVAKIWLNSCKITNSFRSSHLSCYIDSIFKNVIN